MTSVLVVIYSIAGLYFSFLFSIFILSFSKNKQRDILLSPSEKPNSISVVILIEKIEDFFEENIRKIFDQDSPNMDIHEFIVIDKTNNIELLKELGYDFPDKKKMYFFTPKLNINVIREILEHKSSGETFLFIKSNDIVSEKWLAEMEKYCHSDYAVISGKQLLYIDETTPRYFRAIDYLFKVGIQRSLSSWHFNGYDQFTNLLVSRKALFNNKDLRQLKKRMIGNDVETDIFSIESPGFQNMFRYKLEENFWQNELIDKSALNIFYYSLTHLMNILPLLMFLVYLKDWLPLLPLIIILFAKFIGEGLVISRGARMYSQQALLNDFWSWFFVNPPLSFISFILSIFIPFRFYKAKII